MIQFVSRHTLILVYTAVFGVLLFGVYQTSGTTFFGELGIYFISLVGFYALFGLKPIKSFLTKRMRFLKNERWSFNINYLLILVLVFIIFHFFYLGGSPAIKALDIFYSEDVALLRESISKGSPKIILYLTSFCLKSILPFLLLYLVIKKRYLIYWIVLLVAVFYAFSLMQKSYIVGLLLPALIYCILTKRFLFAIKYVALIVMVVVGLTIIANPPGKNRTNLNPTRVTKYDKPASEIIPDRPIEEYSEMELIARGLYSRILIVPGQMVSFWFEVIPAEKPYLHGDGYRLIALARGRPHVNYSVELYPILFPEFMESGLLGSVNVASFMYEYSNFGWPGLILSGFMLAFLLSLIEFFFADSVILKLSINAFPILLLSSGANTTLLFSGGWGFLILLYYIFLQKKVE